MLRLIVNYLGHRMQQREASRTSFPSLALSSSSGDMNNVGGSTISLGLAPISLDKISAVSLSLTTADVCPTAITAWPEDRQEAVLRVHLHCVPSTEQFRNAVSPSDFVSVQILTKVQKNTFWHERNHTGDKTYKCSNENNSCSYDMNKNKQRYSNGTCLERHMKCYHKFKRLV